MGGGGSKNTTTTTVAEPPKWSVPYFKDFYSNTMDLASQPYDPYTGQIVADFSDQQIMGMDMAQQAAMAGTPYADMAGATGANIMGTGINNMMVDYGGGNPYLGATNQFTDSVGQTGINPFLGANPYLENMIDQSASSVMDKYMNSTAPGLQAAEMQQGAFGNTGLQAMRLQAANDLTGSLGDIENQYRFQDYTTQQQLAEAGINRDLQARQFQAGLAGEDLQRNSALSEQIANRIYGASSQNAANNLQAQQIDQSGDLQAMQMAPMLEQLQYLPSEQMMTIGDMIQQQNQKYLSSDYDQWMAANMYPYQQLDLQQNALNTIMGSGGTTTASAPNANYGNTFANLLGGGLMGYSLFNS